MKWNERGLRPHLCTYRLNMLNRARRTSWGWWDEWYDFPPDIHCNSKFESWRSEAEHTTSRSRRLSTILILYEWAGKKHFVSLKLEGQSGVRTHDLRLSKQAILTTAPDQRGRGSTLRESLQWCFWLRRCSQCDVILSAAVNVFVGSNPLRHMWRNVNDIQCQQHCNVKAKSSNYLLFKWAVTVVCHHS